MIKLISRALITSILWLILSHGLSAQEYELSLGENEIEYSSLANFKLKVNSLKTGTREKVRIVHIGDSHIQADKFTGEIRNQLQKVYGNGGRGLVFPFSLAKTNGPKDYNAESTDNLLVCKNVEYIKKFPIGIMGITLKSQAESGTINMKFGIDSVKNRFTNSLLIYSAEKESNITLNNTKEQETIEHNSKMYDTLRTIHSTLQNHINIDWQGKKFSLHGLYLENSTPGIIYNTIGINGARFKDYCATDYFFEQLELIKSDLIIISLGTNESYSSKYTDEDFTKYINLFLSKLKEVCPNTDVILTCPSENYHLRKNVPVENQRVQNVNLILRQTAQKNKMAIWDLYKVMGGKGSMKVWKMEGLINPDYVHFRRDGYKLQGRLFFEALVDVLSK